MADTLLDRLYAVWNAHDVEAILSFFHDDLVYNDRAMSITFNGREELGAFVKESFVAIPDARFELFNSIETLTGVAAEATMRGTFVQDVGPLKATNKEFVLHYAIVGTVRDGKIATLSDYSNPAELTD